MITVYDDETSAAGYTVRAALGVLGLEHTCVAIEEYDGRHADDPPPPVAVVDDRVSPSATLHDPWATLVHLAATHDEGQVLLPTGDPARRATVLDWLAFAGELSRSAGVARRHESYGEPLEPPDSRERAHRLLGTMERHLWFGEAEGHDFLVGSFSLADLACFGDVVLSEEGGVSRQDYPAVRRWCDRVKRTPGLPLMPGIFPAAPERRR